MALLYVCFLLVFGTLNTLTTKWQFAMESEGIDGEVKHFQKPWWGNFAMFAAMIVVLFVYFADEVRRVRAGNAAIPDGATPLLAEGGQRRARKGAFSQVLSEFCTKEMFGAFVAVSVPAVLDLVSSGLNFMGLLCISASVWQMLRGSMIVFSALLSIAFLGRKMLPYHWLGIAVCVVGIACVGSASVLGDAAAAAAAAPDQSKMTPEEIVAQEEKDKASSEKAAFGLVLVMLAQVIQAGQCVAEERLLKNLAIPCTLVVAFEGIWGCAIMCCFVFPFLQSGIVPGEDAGGVMENTSDTLTMIGNSRQLQLMLCIYLISCSTYNIARMLVTSTMSAIHFTMIDCSRTALVWGFDLAIMYDFPASYHQFGESWTSYSPLQAAGFLILICGQCLYGGLIQFPIAKGFFYPDMNEKQLESLRLSPVASRHMATPLPPYSNLDVTDVSKKAQKGKGIYGQPTETLFQSLGKDGAFGLAEGKGRVDAA